MVKTNASEAVRGDRLSRYGVMLTAAVASGAAAGSAEAAIVTSASTGWTAQSLTGTGNVDVTTKITNFGIPGFNGPDASIGGAQVARKARFNGNNGNVSFVGNATSAPRRFASGQVIDANLGVWSNDLFGTLARSNAATGTHNGIPGGGAYSWDMTAPSGPASERGFLAFRFSSGGNYFYGYFDVEVSRTGLQANSTMTLTIHGWAYNDVANQSITIAGASAVPGGAGLAALAVGAAGLRGRRRSRN